MKKFLQIYAINKVAWVTMRYQGMALVQFFPVGTAVETVESI